MLKPVTLRRPSNAVTSSKLGNCNLWLGCDWIFCGLGKPSIANGTARWLAICLLAVLLRLAPCCSSMLPAPFPTNLAALDCQLLALAPGTDHEGECTRLALIYIYIYCMAQRKPSQDVCTAQLLGAEWAQKFVSFSYWAIQLWAGHSRPKVKLLCAPPGSAFSDCGWGWGSCWTASNLRHWQFWSLCLHCAQFGVL